MTISAHIPDNIKRVSRSLGFALWLEGTDDWLGFSLILRVRLTARQRAALAYAALLSQDDEDARLTAETALSEGAGQPMAPLFNHMDESAFWADMATPDELDAYALASFSRMAPQRQADFLGFVQGRAAA
jgi:hypothetical protein